MRDQDGGTVKIDGIIRIMASIRVATLVIKSMIILSSIFDRGLPDLVVTARDLVVIKRDFLGRPVIG
ncbi:MAG: hypothetical protein AAGD47_14075, partial [Pseudomonadota bacterium]